MKIWYWDDPDPRMVWDNPNLRWGDPGYLLEEGDPGYVELQPGQPGYVPPVSPKPKPRTYHRSTMDIPTQMEFTFITNLPSDGKKFPPRPKFGPNWEHDELDGLVHGKFPDVPAATCRAI